MPNTTRFLAVLVLSLATLLTPTTASAHDRPLYAGFGGGPYFLFGCCQVHGRVQGEFGIHFSRDDTGFFLAFEAVSTFGDDRSDDFFMFFGGVRLGGDIEVHGNHEYGILLRPSGLVGFGWHDRYRYNDWGFFVVQPAFDLRFVFAHRVLALWLRPVAFDFLFFWDRPGDGRDWSLDVGYHGMIGMDFQFG